MSKASFERVVFTKKQIKLLRQKFDSANKCFDECLKEKPSIYNESHRASFVCAFLNSFLDYLSDEGYSYLEK